jgi:hypothetical protein
VLLDVLLCYLRRDQEQDSRHHSPCTLPPMPRSYPGWSPSHASAMTMRMENMSIVAKRITLICAVHPDRKVP